MRAASLCPSARIRLLGATRTKKRVHCADVFGLVFVRSGPHHQPIGGCTATSRSPPSRRIVAPDLAWRAAYPLLIAPHRLFIRDSKELGAQVLVDVSARSVIGPPASGYRAALPSARVPSTRASIYVCAAPARCVMVHARTRATIVNNLTINPNICLPHARTRAVPHTNNSTPTTRAPAFTTNLQLESWKITYVDHDVEAVAQLTPEDARYMDRIVRTVAESDAKHGA